MWLVSISRDRDFLFSWHEGHVKSKVHRCHEWNDGVDTTNNAVPR